MNWFDLLAVQGTLKSLLQQNSSKTSICWCSALFMVQLSHPYTGKTIALTVQTTVGKVVSLLFNMLSKFVIAFFSRSKYLLISWLQSLSSDTIINVPYLIPARSQGSRIPGSIACSEDWGSLWRLLHFFCSSVSLLFSLPSCSHPDLQAVS